MRSLGEVPKGEFLTVDLIILTFIFLVSLQELIATCYSLLLSKIVKYAKTFVSHVKDGKWLMFSEIMIVLLTSSSYLNQYFY